MVSRSRCQLRCKGLWREVRGTQAKRGAFPQPRLGEPLSVHVLRYATAILGCQTPCGGRRVVLLQTQSSGKTYALGVRTT